MSYRGPRGICVGFEHKEGQIRSGESSVYALPYSPRVGQWLVHTALEIHNMHFHHYYGCSGFWMFLGDLSFK